MDIKDPVVHNNFSGGDDKTVFFSESVFLCISSLQTGRRDKVIGSGGQTADLSPHSCAVICCAVGSGRPLTQEAPTATQRQLLHPQRLFHSEEKTQ